MPKNVNKLLVANRGEIALRVVRTAREMGIPTVAVYAEQDRHAQYVQMADDAYLLSGDTYKDTYLNEDLLIDILHLAVPTQCIQATDSFPKWPLSHRK